MKKFFSMMAVLAAMFAFVACTKSTDEPGTGNGNGGETPKGGKLATPELTIKEQDGTSFTIAWNAVSGAEKYKVNFKGANKDTTECEYTFENLNAGKYTVMVIAMGEGYENSDKATINVELTGLTEADWFTQEVFLAEDEEQGLAKYNSVWFTWKGTGIADVKFMLSPAEEVKDYTDADFRDDLSSFDAEQLPIVLEYVNSADGFTNAFNGCDGGTNYILCTLVTNTDGVEYMVKNEITTEAVVASEEAKAWVGTWSVNSHNIYSINEKGEGTKSAQEEVFTVTITESSSAPNEVVIDGFSVLGNDWPTFGVVEGDTLYILNGIYLGADDTCYYYWVGWYDDPVGLSVDELPSNVVTMATEGTTATSTNKVVLIDQTGANITVECFCSDVMGVTADGYIQFFIEAFPAVFRSGDMEWTKTAAAPAAKSNNARIVPSAMQTSIVVK